MTTPKITSEFAKVNLKTKVVRPVDSKVDNFRLVTEIKDANNRVVATGEEKLSKYDGDVFEQNLIVNQPKLWDTENPYLYKAVSKLYDGSSLKDEYTTTFGIRSIEIIPGKGFFLNGKLTKFKGVCLHHGVSDVLFGQYNPAGRLTQTWPKSITDLPHMMDYDIRHGRTYMYSKAAPLYPFGHACACKH